MNKKNQIAGTKGNSRFRHDSRSYLFLAISITVTLCTAFFIYYEIQNLFQISLQGKVKSIAQTAVLLFDPNELDEITGPESVGTSSFTKVTLELQKLRLKNDNLKFAYIYRKTDQSHIFHYVADADSLHPDTPIDLNGDGIIDDADALVYPGDEYDASEFPEFIKDAFNTTYVGHELEESQWGLTLDATEPIFDSDGNARYVLGIDVDVSEFARQTNLALVPFLVFSGLLVMVLTFLTLSLVHTWGSRVNLMRDLDRQKDELLSIVSHQLATPVTSIKWYLEMMLDGDMGKMTKEQEENVKGMQHISTNLADLVSMILDVSRIQLGRMKIEKQKLSLQDFFHEILEVIEPKAKEKKINLIKDMPAQLPDAMLDKRYTRMTVENLLSNAVKYTPAEGKVTLDIKIKGNTLYCKVSDTGVGIPKADQDKIFGKLFRASNVRNAVDGNGFGLYVAKGAVEAQGGKIWFESTEGKGTTFFIELPLS